MEHKGTVLESEPIDVILVREITRVRVMTARDKQRSGSNGLDVAVKGVFSGARMISREQLVREYTTCNGKKIKMITIKNGVVYTLLRKCNISTKAKIVKMRNRIAYSVEFNNAAGETTYKTIKSEDFKKMFVIYMQPSLNNGIRELFSESKPKVSKKVAVSGDKAVSISEVTNKAIGNNGRTVINSGVVNEDRSVNNVKQIKENTQNKTGIRVVGKLMNIKGKQVGFVVEDKKGNRRQINIPTARRLTEEKKIDNMMLVTNNGKWFFRGNGMLLESLPKYIL